MLAAAGGWRRSHGAGRHGVLRRRSATSPLLDERIIHSATTVQPGTAEPASAKFPRRMIEFFQETPGECVDGAQLVEKIGEADELDAGHGSSRCGTLKRRRHRGQSLEAITRAFGSRA